MSSNPLEVCSDNDVACYQAIKVIGKQRQELGQLKGKQDHQNRYGMPVI